jgi:hypothetical protein
LKSKNRRRKRIDSVDIEVESSYREEISKNRMDG